MDELELDEEDVLDELLLELDEKDVLFGDVLPAPQPPDEEEPTIELPAASVSSPVMP